MAVRGRLNAEMKGGRFARCGIDAIEEQNSATFRLVRVENRSAGVHDADKDQIEDHPGGFERP